MLDNGTTEERADAQKVEDQLQAFVKGLGLSDDEYREQLQIPTFVKVLTRAAIRQHYIEEIDPDGKMTVDEQNACIAIYIEELKTKYPNQLDVDSIG